MLDTVGARACSAGELSPDEIERLMAVLQNPLQFKFPLWFLNRRRDIRTGKDSQLFANALHTNLRNDIEALKKMR